MRALLFAVALSSVAGCSSTDERTLRLGSVDSDDTTFWLDGSGIDPVQGAGVDTAPPQPCREHDDCKDGFCTKRADEESGFCFAACVAPADGGVPVRACRRGFERCLYVPKSGAAFCVQPCVSKAECTLGLVCLRLSSRRPELGGVCFPAPRD